MSNQAQQDLRLIQIAKELRDHCSSHSNCDECLFQRLSDRDLPDDCALQGTAPNEWRIRKATEVIRMVREADGKSAPDPPKVPGLK